MHEDPYLDVTRQEILGSFNISQMKNKQKKIRSDVNTLHDFINMIKTDQSMQDEFCYLNKASHAYDFRICEFNERNKEE
jgi:hypothetical protein